MNPLAVLLPALHAALTAPALELAGAAVPVGQYFDVAQAGPYVEIDQPTDTDLSGASLCGPFSCTVLLNVVTQFPARAVSGLPAEALVSQINARLRGQRLPLPAGWDCQPGTLEPGLQLKETDGEQRLVRRLLRYRWNLSFHP